MNNDVNDVKKELWKEAVGLLNAMSFTYYPDKDMDESQESPKADKVETEDKVGAASQSKAEILKKILQGGETALNTLPRLEAIAGIEEVPYFTSLIEDEDEIGEVRIEAALALGRLGFKEPSGALNRIFNEEKNEMVQEAVLQALQQINPEEFIARIPVQSMSMLRSGNKIKVARQVFESESKNRFELFLKIFNMEGSSGIFEFNPVVLTGTSGDRVIWKDNRFNTWGAIRFYDLPGGTYSLLPGIAWFQTTMRKADEAKNKLKELKLALCASHGAGDILKPFKWDLETDDKRIKCVVEIKCGKQEQPVEKEQMVELKFVDIKFEFEYKHTKKEKLNLKYSLLNADNDKVIEVKKGEKNIPLEGIVTLSPCKGSALFGNILYGKVEMGGIDFDYIPKMKIDAFIVPYENNEEKEGK